MIELMHPVTVAIAVACAPVATIALSGTIDYLAHRQHNRDVVSALPPIHPSSDPSRSPRATPASDGGPASARKR